LRLNFQIKRGEARIFLPYAEAKKLSQQQPRHVSGEQFALADVSGQHGV